MTTMDIYCKINGGATIPIGFIGTIISVIGNEGNEYCLMSINNKTYKGTNIYVTYEEIELLSYMDEVFYSLIESIYA